MEDGMTDFSLTEVPFKAVDYDGNTVNIVAAVYPTNGDSPKLIGYVAAQASGSPLSAHVYYNDGTGMDSACLKEVASADTLYPKLPKHVRDIVEQVGTTNKITAIRFLREELLERLGYRAGLTETKHLVERVVYERFPVYAPRT